MQIEQREPRGTAVVRRRTTWPKFPNEWRPMLDAVYEQVKAGRVTQNGHNVMVYRDGPDGGVDVEVGIEAAVPFEESGEVVASELPGGKVAFDVHRDGFATLGDTYDALAKWISTEGFAVAGPHWEIYGDPDDSGAVDVEVVWLLQ